MNAATRNAKRLAEDAELLLENDRYASAVAPAVLSIEESGKLSILRLISSAQTSQEAKQRWREYRSHTKKNAMGAFLDLFAQGARRLGDFEPLFMPDAEHTHLFDQLKQIAIYSDCLGDSHWSEPCEVIDKALARNLVAVARLLAREHEVTSLEIELWIKHVAPYLTGSREAAETALESWYAEMQRHQLIAGGENAMSEFIHPSAEG